FTFLPENFFANIDLTINGSKFEKGHFAQRERLTETGKKHLIGIKGGLWAETVQTPERMDYMVLPRVFALAERAWAPKRSYESDTHFQLSEFNADYSAFIQKVGFSELQKVGDTWNFRLPAVGVKKVDGKLHANAEYPGFAIHYTTDGSEPTKNSSKYSTPL